MRTSLFGTALLILGIIVVLILLASVLSMIFSAIGNSVINQINTSNLVVFVKLLGGG